MLIEAPNPRGAVSESDVEDFEQRCVRLPEEFRDYLVRFNGGLPHRRSFWVGGRFQYTAEIKCIFSISVGKEHERLEEWWSLSNCFDLVEHEDELRQILIVGELRGGALLAINTSSGEVLYVVTDSARLDKGTFLSEQTQVVGDSWTRFLEAL